MKRARSWTTTEQRDAEIASLSLDSHIFVEFGRSGSQLARIDRIDFSPRSGSRVWISKWSAASRRWTQSMRLNPSIFLRFATPAEANKILS